MKANELKNFIQPLIAEEVKKQLPKLLFEMLGSSGQPSINKQVVRESHRSDDPIEAPVIQKKQNIVKPSPAAPPKVIKQYVKNPLLNKILNETTPGLPQTPYGATMVDLEAGGFQNIGVSNDMIGGSMKELVNEEVSSIPQSVQEETPIETPSGGPDLSNLFNRNFKAILDKSKKIKPGSGMMLT